MKFACWLLPFLFPFTINAQELTSVGGTATSGSSGLCIGSGFQNISRISNATLTDKASVVMLAGVGCKNWLHTSLNGTGISGSYAGFHVLSASLAGLLNNMEVHTFLNGIWQEGASGNNLLSVIVSAEGDIYFKTSKPYNEVRLVFASLLSVAYGADIFYGFGQTTRPDLEVLPISFHYFTAKRSDDKVALQWQIGTDEQLVEMFVEKSFDGRTFSTAGRVSYNSSGQYRFLDYSNHPTTYYRIKASSENNITYSAVQVVHHAKGKNILRIVTEVHDKIGLELPAGAEGLYTAQLFNMNGQLVHQSKLGLSGACSVPINRLSIQNGHYILKLIAANGSCISQKILLY